MLELTYQETEYQVKELSQREWNQYWSEISRSNLLQSWEYGEAKSIAEGWKPVRLVVLDYKSRPLAIALVLTRTWSFLGGFARINRGPLLINETASPEDAEQGKLLCINAILSIARRRRWWIVQIAPELDNNDKNISALKEMKLKPKGVCWGSARLSLLPTEEELYSNLKGKWRNLLRKSEKSNLVVSNCEAKGDALETLVAHYKELQLQKGFQGVTESMLRHLTEQNASNWLLKLFFAHVKDSSEAEPELAGMLVSIEHGKSATYLIGYTNDLGRSCNANYLMLWRAIQEAKKADCDWFDLGGLNENTPKGVAHFKRGVKAEPYLLVGEWRGWFF